MVSPQLSPPWLGARPLYKLYNNMRNVAQPVGPRGRVHTQSFSILGMLDFTELSVRMRPGHWRQTPAHADDSAHRESSQKTNMTKQSNEASTARRKAPENPEMLPAHRGPDASPTV